MEIKLYTTPTCTWCKQLKEWLKKKKVSYQEIDVVENDREREEMVEKSGQMAVPVVDIDGTIIVGFDEKKLEEKLGKDEKPGKKK
ncbi:glutaredoxin family protein [Candidatus Woesearchaeota archaeon]|nr:glutaredoxin family protein [Candidatus Woesearchaeota archaeon]